MNKKVVVDGLSALTDGHLALYYRLKDYGYEPVLSYRVADRMPSSALEVRKIRMPVRRLFAFWAFIRLLLSEKPAFVEFCLHEFGRLSPLLEVAKVCVCRVLKIPFTVVCTGSEILNYDKNGYLKKKAVKLALRGSRFYLIKESYMKSIIEDQNIADSSKALFIHNGVFEELNKCRLSPMTDDKVVLFFNSFKKWRNVDFIVKAAKQVLEMNENVLFLLVGARNEQEVDTLQADLREIPEINRWRVQVHRMNNNREFYFGLADVFVLPADIVWLNNSVLEAMLLEVPVLLPDVEWVDKIVQDGRNGFTYKHMDLDSFVARLMDVVNMGSSEIKDISDCAKKDILGKFGSEKRALLHHLFYKSCMEGEAPIEELFRADDFVVKDVDEINSIISRT